MKVLTVKKGITDYNIPLNTIMQWCGYNVALKNELVNDIAKYFSASKYMEYEQDMSGNILLNGEKIGRKHFVVYFIDDKDSLLQLIKISKTSIIMRNIKNRLDSSICQNEICLIDECLMRVFADVNATVMESLGDIMIDYDRNELLDIIQQSHIVTGRGAAIESQGTSKLLEIFLRAIEEIQKKEPENILVIFKNIDHMISSQEYKCLVEKCEILGKNSSIYFIMTTSLPGYVSINPMICDSITVFNTVLYSLPSFQHIKSFVEDNYPYNKIFENDELVNEISEAINSVGGDLPIRGLECCVIVKMINSTICIDNKLKLTNNLLLYNYLKA